MLSFSVTELARFDKALIKKICCDLPITRHESLLKFEHPRKKGGQITACAKFPVKNFAFKESVSLAGANAMIRYHFN